MIFKSIKEATLWSETTATLCREVTEPNIEATMRSSGGAHQQWYDPAHAKNVFGFHPGAYNPNPWTRGTRGRRPNSQYNAGRGQEGHIRAHG